MTSLTVESPATGQLRGSRATPWLGILIVLAGWELAGHLLTAAFVLAAPSEVIGYLLREWQLMGRALWTTLGNAAAGFLIGNLAALLLAGVALLWPRSERIVTGLALLVFCLPLVATGPILRVFFGPGSGPQIILAALAVYYTTLIPLLVGLRAAPDSWFDLVRSYGRGRFAALIHVRAMAALPYFFTGLQIAAPAAFLGAMVGEFTGAEKGMGVLTIRALRALDVEMTWAVATVATAVAILAYVAIGSLARRVLLSDPPVILATPQSARTQRTAWWDAVLVTLLALAIWTSALWIFNLNPFFAKGPTQVFDALFIAADAAATRATLGGALSETALFLIPGYLTGLVAGAGLAIVLVLAPALSSTAMPLAIALRSVPIVTTAPLVVLLLGRGATGTITLVAIMVFFPTLVACLHGLRQTPGQVLDVFDSYAAGPVTRLIRVRIPAMLPAFFAAARMAVPASVLAITVAEWLATGSGIGSLMALSASLSDYDMLWSSVVIVSALSALGYGLVGMIERRVLATYAPEQLS
ncbi:ABC transporter permease [Cognatishimia sp. MH4019]|uniref:ABC transporter permease n=1 Tax=Cognatishimia sp. MH4019 TaxID=2854030 RepID=UPI00210594AF|nr:ABC transporter permease subunit [Cognatishimia sp. MH4019]